MKRTTRMLVLLAVGALACGPARTVQGQMLYDFAGSPGIAFDGTAAETMGFDFTMSSTATLTGLGYWDEGSNNLLESHLIGLWDSGGTLLATATVTNGSTAVASADSTGRWLFATIASVTL